MKSLTKSGRIKNFIALLTFSFMQLIVLAQDSGGGESSSTTSSSSTKISVTESENWYASPWVWVVGAALFILLLIALLRGNSSSARTTSTGAAHTDKVTVTKSVRTESDTDPDVV
jgi:hypothetical protein